MIGTGGGARCLAAVFLLAVACGEPFEEGRTYRDPGGASFTVKVSGVTRPGAGRLARRTWRLVGMIEAS